MNKIDKNYFEKLKFFENAIKKQKHIDSSHTNRVFLDFQDMFHFDSRHKNVVLDFKKHMSRIAQLRSMRIEKIRAGDAGRNLGAHPNTKIWILQYR